jgi:acetyl-CoA carboxylase biotin carboxyl carrier protein
VSLTAKEVAEISRLLEESHFDSLELEIDGLKLSLRRTGAAPSPAPATSAAPVAAATATPATRGTTPVSPNSPSPAPRTVPDDPDQHRVKAPFLGTFYRAPKPGAPPFVSEGSTVGPDTVIGIIEVMKLMNSVRAGVGGKVSAILAQDGALVEYGETLLLVAKAG